MIRNYELPDLQEVVTSKQSQNIEIATALFQKLDDNTKDSVLELLRMMVASKKNQKIF